MNQLVSKQLLEKEVWRTIKLERIEDDPAPKPWRLFAFVSLRVRALFRRIPYMWFLFISVLEVNAQQRDYRMLIPFAVLLALDLFLSRFQQRKQRTHAKHEDSEFEVWSGVLMEPTPAAEIKAGDIVLLNSGDFFPADILVLATGRPDHAALVDEFPYFGTPRIKCKAAVSETQRIIKSTLRAEALSRLRRLRGTVKVTQSLTDTSHFRGHIKLSGYPTASTLSVESLALKGSRLCSTPWVLGLVVYAREDCKIEISRSATKREKSTKVERLMNKFLTWYFAALILTAFICAGIQSSLHHAREPFGDSFIAFCLLLAQAVPASVYLLLDLARVTQVLFLCAEGRGDEVTSHNYRLVETLGEVEYVLTDKTGTLTENDISLKTLHVSGRDYIRCSLAEKMHRQLCLGGVSADGKDALIRTTTAETACITREEEEVCGFSELQSMLSRGRSSPLAYFCECIALCNTVEATPTQEFTSQSRHEMALVRGVVDLGVAVHEKTPSFCSLTVAGRRSNYDVVATSDFKPCLHRMRVLVQQHSSLEGLLVIKGAADAMKPLMVLDEDEATALDRKLAEMKKRQIHIFVYAAKRFSHSEMEAIREKLEFMRRFESSARKVEGLFKELERDSEYLGFAGLEDPIRTETVDALSRLRTAGVKVWILSGDRESSALAAALEAGMLQPMLPVVSLVELEHISVCRPFLANSIRRYILREGNSDFGSPELECHNESPLNRQKSEGEPVLQRRSVMYAGKKTLLDIALSDVEPRFALTVDGTSFRTALTLEETRKMLAALLQTADTVLFHSMLPYQKALVTRFVRENFYTRPVTLAVGDEVNDIAMVQEADVGIVVRRPNNSEVARIGDFEVSSFAALSTLLLRHGKDAYYSITYIARLLIHLSSIPAVLSLFYIHLSNYTATALVPPTLWVLHSLLGGILVLTTSVDTSPEDVLYSVRFVAFSTEVLYAAGHSGLIFMFVSLSDRWATYDLLTVRSSLCMTAATLIHIQVNAKRTGAMAYLLLGLLLGTHVFALRELLDSQDNSEVLNQLFTSPANALGELAAILSCAVLSYLSYARKAVSKDPGIATEPTYCATAVVTPESTTRTKRESFGTLSRLYRDTPFWKLQQKLSNYTMHGKWLEFSSSIIEDEYRREVTLVYLKKAPMALFAGALCIYQTYYSSMHTFYIGSVVLYFIASVLVCISPFLRSNLELVTSLQFLLISAKLGVELEYEYTDLLSYLLPVAHSLFMIMDWKHNAVLLGWNLLTVYITVLLFQEDHEAANIAATMALISVFTASLIVFNYLNEKESRTEFHLLKITKLEVDRAKDVLYCLLPSFVLKQVWNRELPIALDQTLVTVLFCDICDFDFICSNLSAQELMDLLDDLFKKLDDMCETHGLSKVETVGKTYLACAGLKEREVELSDELAAKNHAKRACDMAFDIQVLFQEFTVVGKPLRANIGINSGPVIAGVVGSEKPQFALVGDTVNTASRMSSTAPYPSAIQISTETYALLRNNLDGMKVTQRTVQVKGKGEMAVYLIEEDENRLCDVVSPKTPMVRGRRGRKPEALNLSRKELFGNWRFSTMLDREALAAALMQRSASNIQRMREEEAIFRESAIKRQYQRLYWGFAMLTGVATLEVTQWGAHLQDAADYAEFAPLATMFLACLAALASFRKLAQFQWFSWILCALGLLFAAAITHSNEYYEHVHLDHTVLVLTLIVVYFEAQGGLYLRHSVAFSVVLSVYWVGMLGRGSWTERLRCALGVAPALVISLCFAHKKQHSLRVYTSFEINVSEQKQKTDEIIRKMMPQHVYESLLEEKHKADWLTDVTLLFADIVGFTALSSTRTPTVMVSLLNDLFSGFDSAAARNCVYKVHTIGDCYVAMGYTGVSGGRDRLQECMNVLNLAFDMILVISDFNRHYPDANLGMRIGIHTGQITAGITGAKIVRYDIYGPDVLIANKMESSGTAGRVHISQSTKDLIEASKADLFSFELTKDVEIKPLNTSIKGYFIDPRSTDK